MSPSKRSNGSPRNRDGFGARVGHINATAQQLWSEAQETVTDLAGSVDLRGRVQRHPYRMVLGALGVGYVLGGGAVSGLTFRLLRTGLRIAALPLIRGQVLGLIDSAVSGLTGSGESRANSGGEAPVSSPS